MRISLYFQYSTKCETFTKWPDFSNGYFKKNKKKFTLAMGNLQNKSDFNTGQTSNFSCRAKTSGVVILISQKTDGGKARFGVVLNHTSYNVQKTVCKDFSNPIEHNLMIRSTNQYHYKTPYIPWGVYQSVTHCNEWCGQRLQKNFVSVNSQA